MTSQDIKEELHELLIEGAQLKLLGLWYDLIKQSGAK
jgi:hypothetical protein